MYHRHLAASFSCNSKNYHCHELADLHTMAQASIKLPPNALSSHSVTASRFRHRVRGGAANAGVTPINCGPVAGIRR